MRVSSTRLYPRWCDDGAGRGDVALPRARKSQRVRFVELGRVIADRAAPEALRIERYLTPISNNRYPLATTFLPRGGAQGQFGTFVPQLWTLGIMRTNTRRGNLDRVGEVSARGRLLGPPGSAVSRLGSFGEDAFGNLFHRFARVAGLALDVGKRRRFVEAHPAHDHSFGPFHQLPDG